VKRAFKLTTLKKTILFWSLVFLPTIIIAAKAYAPVFNDNWARGGAANFGLRGDLRLDVVEINRGNTLNPIEFA
jgi:hypothetical protein